MSLEVSTQSEANLKVIGEEALKALKNEMWVCKWTKLEMRIVIENGSAICEFGIQKMAEAKFGFANPP